MGRIKTTQVKRASRKLVSLYGTEFGGDFAGNKNVVGRVADIRSKKLRNVITGYVTRLAKRQQP